MAPLVLDVFLSPSFDIFKARLSADKTALPANKLPPRLQYQCVRDGSKALLDAAEGLEHYRELLCSRGAPLSPSEAAELHAVDGQLAEACHEWLGLAGGLKLDSQLTGAQLRAMYSGLSLLLEKIAELATLQPEYKLGEEGHLGYNAFQVGAALACWGWAAAVCAGWCAGVEQSPVTVAFMPSRLHAGLPWYPAVSSWAQWAQLSCCWCPVCHIKAVSPRACCTRLR